MLVLLIINYFYDIVKNILCSCVVFFLFIIKNKKPNPVFGIVKVYNKNLISFYTYVIILTPGTSVVGIQDNKLLIYFLDKSMLIDIQNRISYFRFCKLLVIDDDFLIFNKY